MSLTRSPLSHPGGALLDRAESQSSLGSLQEFRTGGRWFVPRPRPIFFPRIDDSHCDKIRTSFTAVPCFNNGYVGKQPVALKEHCAGYWLKEFQEGMDMCTGGRDITAIRLKIALNTIQSVSLLGPGRSVCRTEKNHGCSFLLFRLPDQTD